MKLNLQKKEKTTKTNALKLFETGKLRKENISKGSFRFASVIYLEEAIATYEGYNVYKAEDLN